MVVAGPGLTVMTADYQVISTLISSLTSSAQATPTRQTDIESILYVEGGGGGGGGDTISSPIWSGQSRSHWWLVGSL